MDAIEGVEGVVDCCRRVHSHLKRLKVGIGTAFGTVPDEVDHS
jgi:hypothetical protein